MLVCHISPGRARSKRRGRVDTLLRTAQPDLEGLGFDLVRGAILLERERALGVERQEIGTLLGRAARETLPRRARGRRLVLRRPRRPRAGKALREWALIRNARV